MHYEFVNDFIGTSFEVRFIISILYLQTGLRLNFYFNYGNSFCDNKHEKNSILVN